MTLLEEAMKVKVDERKGRQSHDTDEVMELAIAWAKDMVRPVQVAAALKSRTSGNVLYAMAVGLRRAFRKGKIKEIEAV